MATVAVLGKTEEARRGLQLAVEELGHRAAPAADLKAVGELLCAAQPPTMLVVGCQPDDRLAERALAEVDRLRPLLPVVVALTRRDARRALALMQAGAVEVLPPPWTGEGFSAAVSKVLRFPGTSFDPAPPEPENRNRRAAFLVAGVMALTIAAIVSYNVRSARLKAAAVVKPPPTEWELPYAHPSGLAFRKGELWIGDWFSQSVHRHQLGTLTLLRSAHLPKAGPAALALTPEALWIASPPGILTRHLLDERLTAVARLTDSQGPSLSLAYDGLYLWSIDQKTRRLHKRLPDAALTVLASFPYPGGDPAAIAFDGKDLWTLDASNKELVRHSIEHPGQVTLRMTLRPYVDGQWRPTGLAWDGKDFWSVAEPRGRPAGLGRVFRHSLAPPL